MQKFESITFFVAPDPTDLDLGEHSDVLAALSLELPELLGEQESGFGLWILIHSIGLVEPISNHPHAPEK
jgi:hypothetical protein